MRELIKEAIADLKKSDGFIYVTSEGEKIDLHEAAKKGIAVTPMDPKETVIKKLAAAGLDLADGRFVNELNELINLINGTTSSSKSGRRRTFSASEKEKIVEEWKKVEAAGKKTKAAFAREIGVGYQTFINWLRS
ncbi:transposase [Algoriphagus namhaensis]